MSRYLLLIVSSCLAVTALQARAQADPAKTCTQSPTSIEATITACSAAIEAGSLSGRALAAAYAQRGFANTLKRDLKQAESDLDAAVKADPDYAQGYTNRANFWNVSDKPDRALADAERAVRLNPDWPLAYYVRANAARKLGELDRAIADYSIAIDKGGGKAAEIVSGRGYAYHRKGDDTRAVDDYSAALKLVPDDVGTLLNRGDALRNLKQMDRANADYSAAIKLAPNNAGGYKGRGFIRLSTQQYDGAVADFTEALRLDPDSATYLNRGAALALQSQYARALADDAMAIKLEPRHPLAYVNRAETMAKLGDKVAARNALDRALQLAPGYPPAVEFTKKLGDVKRGKEPSREAASRAYQRCSFPTTDVGPSEDDIRKTITACTLLINSQGGNAENRALVHLQRGSMYRRLGQFERALVDFDESVRYDPQSALGYTGRGNAYRGLKLLDLSVADHTEAIRLDPKDASSYNNRGNTLRDQKDFAGAIADYDAAIKRNPS